MLRFIYANDLSQDPDLADQMFRDRACQFRDRLGWPVHVDADGWERDLYDELNPLYVIWQEPDGSHGGSMRFLPTTGRTMIGDVFPHLGDVASIKSPYIWECTRFCLSKGAGAHVAAALMLGGGELMRNFELTHFAGVFDARMVRIYRMIGASPDIIGSEGEGRFKISLGVWPYRPEDRARVLDRAGVTSDQAEAWFAAAFGSRTEPMPVTFARKPPVVVHAV